MKTALIHRQNGRVDVDHLSLLTPTSAPDKIPTNQRDCRSLPRQPSYQLDLHSIN